MSQKLNTYLPAAGQPESDLISPSGSARVACAETNSACETSLENRTAAGGESFQDDEDARFADRLLHYAAEMRNAGIMEGLITSVRYGNSAKKNKPTITFIVQNDDVHSLLSDESFNGLMDKVEKWKISAEERKAKQIAKLEAELAKLKGGAL